MGLGGVKVGCYKDGSGFGVNLRKYSRTPALMTYFLSLRVLSFCSRSKTLDSSALGLASRVCLIFLTRSELILRAEGC